MKNEINNLEDVVRFSESLIAEGTSFHPDDDFSEYINISENIPAYTCAEAEIRNQLMSQCFQVCEKHGIDIYEFMLDISRRNWDLVESKKTVQSVVN